MAYLLPCACGQRLPVDASQCGRTIVCACGTKNVVPNLRGLMQLERDTPTPTAASRAVREWSLARGIAGTALAPLAAALALGVYWYLRVPEAPNIYPPLDGLSPRQVVGAVWQPLVEGGIDDSAFPPIQQYLAQRNYRRGWLLACGLVAAASLAVVIAGLAWPRKPAK